MDILLSLVCSCWGDWLWCFRKDWSLLQMLTVALQSSWQGDPAHFFKWSILDLRISSDLETEWVIVILHGHSWHQLSAHLLLISCDHADQAVYLFADHLACPQEHHGCLNYHYDLAVHCDNDGTPLPLVGKVLLSGLCPYEISPFLLTLGSPMAVLCRLVLTIWDKRSCKHQQKSSPTPWQVKVY